MKLTEAIQNDLRRSRVHVSFANRETVKLWNSLRDHNEPPIFTGWYWLQGTSEGGPFRCESAAMRDAWYRVVLGREPPLINSTKVMRAALRGTRAPLRLVR